MEATDWQQFLALHDLTWQHLPRRWEEAPYFGNGLLGSMFYQDGDNHALCLQLFRSDVHDHRDNTDGWTAYSRPRFVIGHFLLELVGKLLGCAWRLDLWNAELRGTITTDTGCIGIRHYAHADEMLLVTELEPSAGEQACRWTWHPGEAKTTRKGIPCTPQDIEAFANQYGEHYRTTLRLYDPNPPARLEEEQGVNVCVQDLLVGGQYATAWQEVGREGGRRLFLVSITNAYPERTARDEAVQTIRQAAEADEGERTAAHRRWWHAYYPASLVALPDKGLERFYWLQIYKLASATRADRAMMDTSGPWFQPTPWPYITWDLNVQLCYWPVYASNRCDLGLSLVETLYRHRDTLTENVRPVEWQADSAFIHVTTAQDLREPRDGDRRYYECVGNLTWALHNCWLYYRHTMDDAMLREKLFPLLRRGVGLYLHMLEEGEDGKLHLPPTYSPEYYAEDGSYLTRDCNYDLALLRWGCQTLLWITDRLRIQDPWQPRWQDVMSRLADFPADEDGFRIGRDLPFARSHRHYSHLLMIYPLYLVNITQGETQALMERSIAHWIGMEGGLHGYSFTGAASMMAAMGRGNEALEYLKGLEHYLLPNGLYKEAGPCLETPLSGAQCVHDMLLQSWGDTIRVFPSVPDKWGDVGFENLRAEGAFLVSARRRDGRTEFVRIRSLAGEPCRIAPGLSGPVRVLAEQDWCLQAEGDGVYVLHLGKGEEAVLYGGEAPPDLVVRPITK